MFAPLAFSAEERAEERRWSQDHQSIGRLAAGATIQQAQSRIDALNARVVEAAGSLKTTIVTRATTLCSSHSSGTSSATYGRC